MRTYAIDKNRDGTICRSGLNEFLNAHGLATYEPRFEARADITVQITVPCDEDEGRDDIEEILNRYLNVESEDEDRLIVYDWMIRYGGIEDIEEVTD